MKVFFARHGESQANVLREISNRGLKHPLTRQGREDALMLARKLRRRSITRIYSSPILRAIETTALVASTLDVEYEVTEGLREYDAGILEGRSDVEAWRLWRDLFEAWTHNERRDSSIEGGESFHQVQERFVAFVDGLVRQYGQTSSNLLCVAHAGLYWMMLPLVVKGVDYELIAAHHGFDHGAVVASELNPDGLVFREWLKDA